MDKRWAAIPRTLNSVFVGVSGERKVEGFSKWIQRYQGTDYSHAITLYYSRDFKDFIITNCHGKAVQLDTPEQFNETSLIRRLWEIECTSDQRDAFVRKMVELDGSPYSPVNQLAWLVVARYFKWKWSPFADGNDSFWCSEYLDEMQRSVEIPASYQILDKGRNNIVPMDNVKALELLASQHGRVREVIF